jgi:hypothetical protein
MKYHINHNKIALRNISHVIHHVKDDKTRWYKVNWIIVNTSHAIYKTHGAYGHKGIPRGIGLGSRLGSDRNRRITVKTNI